MIPHVPHARATARPWKACLPTTSARRAWRCLLLGAVILTSSVEPAWALDPGCSLIQYNTRTWRRGDRLPSNSVNAIVQAEDGHLWLGTPRGLVDFDGIEFRACGLPGQDESRSQSISVLGLRKAGGFWVGTERGGYGWFDGSQFVTWPVTHLGGELPTTRCILERPDGTVFISTHGSIGLRLPSGEEKSLATGVDVLAIAADRQGRIWLGTAAHGLYYWQDGQLHQVGGPAGALWGSSMISAIAVDDAGVVWIGASNGLHSINPDLSPRPPIGFGGQPHALLVDSHGALWIGSMFDGVARYHGGRIERLTRREGLASDHVLALAESADGSLWIGTEDGLSQLADVKFPAIPTGGGSFGESSLCVAASPDGSIWAGTTNGLAHITDAGITRYGTNRTDGFTSEWIRRVFVARNGDLYLLGGRQDLSRFRNGRVDKVWYFDLWPQSVAEDATGIVVTVGTQLRRLVDEQIVPFTLADGSPPRIPGWINKLYTAGDGSLWIAAKPGLVQIRDGKTIDWMHGRSDSDQSFYDICEDTQGTIWAVRNSGLVRIKDGRVASIDHRKGLFSDDIYTLTPDLIGHLWADSPEGFFRMNLEELNAVADGIRQQVNCTVFDGAHVVKTSEKINGETSSCRSLDGRIWLPCARGAIRIDPAHLPINSRPPPIRLERILLDGREMPAGSELRTAAGVRNLEIAYEAIDYQAPERIRYRYRLEGYQSEWVEAGTRRAAFFTNLAPGRYRFEVRACNADGIWNTTGASFSFVQPQPIYASWWFRTLAALALAAGLSLFWISRERTRRREIGEIRRREQLQREMIESSPVPMAMLDQRHRITYVNATFTRVFGFTAPEIPSLDAWWRLSGATATTPDTIAIGWDRRIADAAAARRSIEPVEATLAHKGGSPRQVVVTTSAVGECTLVVCSDLTERKHAEDQRRLLEEQLIQTQKMEAVGRLSGGIAHDFNNLLTIVLGNVALLELEKVPGEMTELIHEIKAAASRAANLTRQLLAFSRKQPIHPAAVDLNHIVHEMTGMLRRLVGEDIAIELGTDAHPAPTRADATMIEQVILNLALNARDAMPRGGKLFLDTAVVDIPPESVPDILNARPGRFSCLIVGDNGAGIPPEILPRIFEPFFTTKEVGKGTGLGLATVFGIVAQHKGWIDVRSKPGHGTTFRIMLPHEATATATATAPTAPVPPSASRVILLVEDDAGVRTLAKRALTSHGHRVIEADSGAHALPIWKEHRDEIDILFTDVIMPGGLNGIELANHLLTEKPSLKVLFASGYSADVTGGNFSGREGIDFLGKPYDPADLLRLVAHTAAPPHGAATPPQS